MILIDKKNSRLCNTIMTIYYKQLCVLFILFFYKRYNRLTCVNGTVKAVGGNRNTHVHKEQREKGRKGTETYKDRSFVGP